MVATDRLSPYGYIKKAEVLSFLSPQEREELRRLESRTRRSEAAQQRLEDLWDRAFALHVAPTVDPLFAYAEEVGERMRA
jgi:hypothetical protein